MTEDELKAIRERAEAATPGPWTYKEWPAYSVNNEKRHVAMVSCWNDGSEPHMKDTNIANTEFIAHAREDIPALLDEIDKQAAEIERLWDALECLADETNYTMRLSGYTGDMMWDAPGCSDEHPWDFAKRKMDEAPKGGE